MKRIIVLSNIDPNQRAALLAQRKFLCPQEWLTWWRASPAGRYLQRTGTLHHLPPAPPQSPVRAWIAEEAYVQQTGGLLRAQLTLAQEERARQGQEQQAEQARRAHVAAQETVEEHATPHAPPQGKEGTQPYSIAHLLRRMAAGAVDGEAEQLLRRQREQAILLGEQAIAAFRAAHAGAFPRAVVMHPTSALLLAWDTWHHLGRATRIVITTMAELPQGEFRCYGLLQGEHGV